MKTEEALPPLVVTTAGLMVPRLVVNVTEVPLGARRPAMSWIVATMLDVLAQPTLAGSATTSIWPIA
jgi:hypothetical protein